MPLRRINSSVSIDTSAATMSGGGDAAGGGPMQSPGVVSNANTTTTTAAAASTNTSGNKIEYVTYLTSYEGMVRHQDLEFEATSGHVKAIFERVQTLGRRKNGDGDAVDATAAPRGMLTYLQIRRCLLRMGVGWNRSLPAGSTNDDGDDYYDDDVSVLSLGSASSLQSGGISGDIISTDIQLIMLLATLAEEEEKYRAEMLLMMEEQEQQPKSSKSNGKYQVDQGLFLPEFTQVYKLIITGMQSLKAIPNPAESVRVMDRVKERTLGMIRPFGPDFDMYKDNSSSPSSKNAFNREDSNDALTSNNNSLRGNYMNKDKKKSKSSTSANVDMKLMRSKDVALAKILEDHELEMDTLASSMHQLRLEEMRTKDALKRRRKRTRLAAMVLGGICVATGVVAEYGRREFRANELALGQEVERRVDKERIATLKERKRELEKRLGVMEGKMRYQGKRNDEIETKTQKVDKEFDDVDVKWFADKAEIERCNAAEAEMQVELQREQSKEDGVVEELTWCNTRLRSQERKLNDLEHVSSSGGSASRGLIAETDDEGDTNAAIQGEKLVSLEMKYNKSIRSSMILRQAYSAIGGLAVSVLVQGLVPAAIKLLAPRALIVVPPPPIRNANVEMAVVDGIFGSSVAFLLIQAIVTFISPL